ncbi:hypothetical protein [Bradyrhizobium sp. 197]|uniref:hypothetical protein n=1 Tax=Bradyrhizobium sp. 197 TaxID=2782663 RepID=UPI001FF98949|nr:hypothetical protein [Bradyrhizobium sp. 197]
MLEKLVCGTREAITQPPAPSHPIAAGRAGPKLLPMFCLPSTACTCRSIVRATFTSVKASSLTDRRLADWVGTSAATLKPLVDGIRSHVFAAERIHAEAHRKDDRNDLKISGKL